MLLLARYARSAAKNTRPQILWNCILMPKRNSNTNSYLLGVEVEFFYCPKRTFSLASKQTLTERGQPASDHFSELSSDFELAVLMETNASENLTLFCAGFVCEHT